MIFDIAPLESYTMVMLSQLSFQNWKTEIRNHLAESSKNIGGAPGKRKVSRPLSTRVPLHLVMKTAHLRRSESLLRPRLARMARQVLFKQAAHFHIQIRQIVITADQIHLLLEIKNRQEFARFLRASSGLIARFALGRERGHALVTPKTAKSAGFWLCRPLTRLVEGLNSEDWLFAALQRKKGLAEVVRLAILEPFLLTPTANTS